METQQVKSVWVTNRSMIRHYSEEALRGSRMQDSPDLEKKELAAKVRRQRQARNKGGENTQKKNEVSKTYGDR